MHSIEGITDKKYDRKDINLITLSGLIGSGKSAISRLLVQKFWYEHISIGEMRREAAKKKGIENITEFNKLGELPGNEREFDLQYEEIQRALDPREKIVLDSRLGFFCQPESFKVWLIVDPMEAARRTFEKRRIIEKCDSIEKFIRAIQKRNEWDISRFFKLYRIDISLPDYFDLLVNTSGSAPIYSTSQKNIDMIMDAFVVFKSGKL